MLEDGRRIFLLRPAFLNKGIDFQVWVQKFDGYFDHMPSHKDVFADLRKKAKENPANIPQLGRLIDQVYTCQEPDSVLGKEDKNLFHEGLPIEMLLKVLKWLFIEQDVTYWNYSGRGKLRAAIKEQIMV